MYFMSVASTVTLRYSEAVLNFIPHKYDKFKYFLRTIFRIVKQRSHLNTVSPNKHKDKTRLLLMGYIRGRIHILNNGGGATFNRFPPPLRASKGGGQTFTVSSEHHLTFDKEI